MKNKKILLSTLSLVTTGLIVVPTVTSCADVSQKIIDNLVDKGKSQYFATFNNDKGVGLLDEFKLGMTTKTGFSAFKTKLVDDILYNWYKSNKDSQTSFKDNWDQWNKDAKKAYDDKVSSYKDSHKNDWAYYFQNEVLDPVGGTKDAFIRNEICAKVRDAVADLFFATDDLKIPQVNTQNYDERSQIWNGGTSDKINDSTNWKYINFFSSIDPVFDSAPFLANQYAKIQKFTFERYLKDVRPISTAMCLWKYSNPSDDAKSLSKIYNTDKIPSDSTTNDGELTASYKYPYFAWATSPLKPTTASDFYFNFASNWTNKNSYIEGEAGKINIPVKNNTEDSATLMITESKTAFSNLDTTFAGAVADLWEGYTSSNTHLNGDYRQAELDIPEVYQETDILDNFFFGSTNNAALGKYVINLSDLYGDLTNSETSIFAKDSKYFLNGTTFVIPAVRLTDGTNPLPYILIRDSFGVHVVGLDCAEYITKEKAASTTRNYYEIEGDILKFRSLNESYGFSQQGTGMTLNSKIKDYFKSNIDDIILEMADAGVTAHTSKNLDELEEQVIFDKKAWGDKGIEDKLLSVVTSGNLLFAYYDVLSSLDDANKKIFSSLNTYVSNHIFNKANQVTSEIYKNGLATPLPFVINSGSIDATRSLFNTTDTYDVTQLIFGFDSNYFSSNISPIAINANNLETQKTQLISDINALWIAGQYNPNTSKNDSLKYSEHIIIDRKNSTDDLDNNAADAINSLFNAFGGAGDNLMSNYVKYTAFHDYYANSRTQWNVEDYKDALTSMYYTSKVLSSDTPISYYYNNDTLTGNADVSFKKIIQDAYEAKKQKSIANAEYEFSSDSIEYETTIATLYYLTKNNNENLIKHLRNIIAKNTSAYIVWNVNDLVGKSFNTDFSAKSTDQNSFNNIFGYNPNYLGLYDKTYQSTNITNEIPVTKGFIENPNYYHYCNMSYYDNANAKKESTAMGFAGVITSTSSAGLDSELSNILFNKNNKHLYSSGVNAKSNDICKNGKGSLYQYGSIDQLKNTISSSQGIDEIKGYALAIENSIPTNANYEIIVSQIKNGKDKDGNPLTTAEQYKNILLTAFPSANNNDAIINEEMFKPLNFSDPETGGIQLSNDNSATTVDCAIKLDGTGYGRVYAIQFANQDLYNTGEDVNDYAAISNHLNTIFGNNDVLKTIAVQYAMQSQAQSDTTSDVIRQFGKVKVYDRRFNDQLGDYWVDGWKKTN